MGVVTESTCSDEKPSLIKEWQVAPAHENNFDNTGELVTPHSIIYKEVDMEEVSVPYEVLQKAEASETQSQANYVNSGEFLRRFIRRIETKPQGGNYGESF